MNKPKTYTIEWENYSASAVMEQVVATLNQRSLQELLTELPLAKKHVGAKVAFDYRIYTQHNLDEVEVVYVLLNGFGVSAVTPDSGIKELITDLLLEQVEPRKYAVLVVGGLFSFPANVRTKLRKQGSGALAIVAKEVAKLLPEIFGNLKTTTVSGYSLGGVLAPLVAQAITNEGKAQVEQVGCGEPNYINSPSTKLQLLRRVSHATAYRNDQINASAIHPYIAIKQTPTTAWAMFTYRAKQYRPLMYRSLSMRLVVQDLALQAHSYPVSTEEIQVGKALLDLAKRGVRINLLHAELSSLCEREPFEELSANLNEASNKLMMITIRGKQADHGIEEHRTLSTPFLVKPELYLL